MYKPALTFASRLLASLALLTALSSAALAQDRYRAEIVVLERLADPILEENMAGKIPEPVTGNRRLWVVDSSGDQVSDINTTSNLTLNNAAARLENSGKYRVLMKTGWFQRFPPNYNGEPLQIELGDYLESAGHRAIEGTIEINRRRYLLVTLELNHWQEASGNNSPARSTASSGEADRKGQEEQQPPGDGETSSEDSPIATGSVGTAPSASSNKELITWIRETRRMRSKEVHFVDSPTIGVLIYFRPLD